MTPLTPNPPATAEELSAFFRSADDYYLTKWPSKRAAKLRFAGLNWAVLLVGPLWFLYRRLWKGAVFCYLVEFGMTAVLSGLSFLKLLVLFRLLLWLCANSYYLWTAARIISAVRSESLPHGAYLERLKALGGTSETAVVVGITINVIIAVVSIGLKSAQSAV